MSKNKVTTNGVPQEWPIRRLKKHPWQQEIFGDLPEHELAALADDIEANGLQHPIEILPDGTILAGHQRVTAARRLGWKKIDVIVRDDLVDTGQHTIDSYFIGDNLFRRQLSPLGRARCIRHLIELDQTILWRKAERTKDEIAKQLGISARTVNRYLLVLDAPVEIQQAFNTGTITLVNAGKIALLPKRQQQEAAQRIADGESPKAVVAEYIHGGTAGADIHRSYLRLIGALDREIPLLDGRTTEIPASRIVRWSQTLRSASSVLNDLLRRIEPSDET